MDFFEFLLGVLLQGTDKLRMKKSFQQVAKALGIAWWAMCGSNSRLPVPQTNSKNIQKSPDESSRDFELLITNEYLNVDIAMS